MSYLFSLLQNFTKGNDLERLVITWFTTSYLTLSCLMEKEGALIRMPIANEWTSSKFAKSTEGKHIEEVVMDNKIWKNIFICLNGA